MLIRIQHLNKVFNLEISNEESIVNIERKIETYFNLAPENQILIYKGEISKNTLSVDQFKIKEDSTIKVINKNGLILFAKTMQGKTIMFEATPAETIADVKEDLKENVNLETDDFFLQFQGEVLENNKTIDDYQITNKCVVNIIGKLKGGVQIFAKTIEGKSVTIEIFKNENVIDLKKKIQEKTGIQSDEQKLIFNGINLVNDKLLEEYEVVEKSVINIIKRQVGISILVKMLDGRTIALEILKHEKIIDLKEKIKEKVGITVEEQRLVYQGKLLVDEIELDEYGIVEKCVVNLIVRLKGGTQICHN